MKRQFLLTRMLLLFALIVGSGNVWADTAGLTFTGKPSTVTNGTSTSGTLTGTQSESWSWASTHSTKSPYHGTLSQAWQIGKNGDNCTSLSFSTSGITGTITSIVVRCSSYNGAKVSAKVNDVAFGTQNQTTTNSLSDYTFSGSATGNISITFTNTSRYIAIKSITVTYSAGGGGDPVAATGVSLNKSTTSLTVGDTEKLIATVAPNNATDKGVSWNSNNTSVASVDSEGNVTAAALGIARITVTTHDGSFTDYCDVTVVPVAATLDLTSNTGWGFPTEKTVGPKSYTNGYTVTLKGSTGQGYYFDTNNLLLGKNGATLTLPAFPFKVSKIKVYGTSGASASVTFNIFVGDEAVSTSATSSKVDHEFEIDAEKQDAGTVYVIKVTNDNNMRISKIKIFGYTSVTIASACTDGKGKYYGTYSNSSAFVVPEGLTVSEIGIVDNKLYVEDYAEGGIVPANTGVMISATSAGEKTLTLASGGSSVLDTDNCLKPSGNAGIDADAMAAAAPSCKYYRLTMHNGTQIGYYWGADEGAAFSLAANKAYLAVPKSIPSSTRSGFSLFGDDETTGIEAVDINTESANVAREYYNLNGQRVANPSKGLYIVNGKKVIIK